MLFSGSFSGEASVCPTSSATVFSMSSSNNSDSSSVNSGWESSVKATLSDSAILSVLLLSAIDELSIEFIILSTSLTFAFCSSLI